MPNSISHAWIIAPYTQDCERVRNTLDRYESLVYIISCHRQLRGSYTGTGELLRKLVPEVYRVDQSLVTPFAKEILSIAPELQSLLPMSPELCYAFEMPQIDSHTPYEGRDNGGTARRASPVAQETSYLANGLVTFLQKVCSLLQIAPITIVFQQFHEADALDQEFVSTLLRRGDPSRLQIIIETSEEAIQTLPVSLQSSLDRYTTLFVAKSLSPETLQSLVQVQQFSPQWKAWCQKLEKIWEGELEDLACLYQHFDSKNFQPEPDITSVDSHIQFLVCYLSPKAKEAIANLYITSDGTSDSVLQKLVYEQIDSETRKRLHDQRANYLEYLNEWSYTLGAIPFHRERGLQLASTKGFVLAKAAHYCISRGYHEAASNLAQRGCALTDPEKQIERYSFFTGIAVFSAIALQKFEEAEKLLHKIRSLTDSPMIHSTTSYDEAMLYARYHSVKQRDYQLAKQWMQNAIAFVPSMPRSEAYKEAALDAHNNAVALIEYRTGNLQEALRLISNTLIHLDQRAEPESYVYQRVSTLRSRALLYININQLDQALEDYHAVIKLDPRYGPYYLERGNLYRSLNRNEQALDDYNQAIRYSFHNPDIYYNRALTFFLLGDSDKALSDYSYVLELNPHHTYALINRASLYYEREMFDEAWKDIERGLILEPNNTSFLSLRGLLETSEGKQLQAYHTFSIVLEYDSRLATAWANRAVVRYEQGDLDGCIEDLSQALQLEESADICYNRGLAYQEKKSWQLAIADYSQALTFPDADTQEIFYRRACCYLQVRQKDLAYRDIENHLASGPSNYHDEIQALESRFSLVFEHLHA